MNASFPTAYHHAERTVVELNTAMRIPRKASCHLTSVSNPVLTQLLPARSPLKIKW
jgi:hypothetical protein